MTTPSTPQTGRRSTWLRKLLFLGGGLFLLLIVAYFVVTSSAFFKGVILPRAGKAVGGEVTVTGASISPFSQVKLSGLKVVTSGTEPLLVAEEVVLRYSLFAILGGNLKVDEVTIASPRVVIVENADGSSNLDPLLKSDTTAAPERGSGTSDPPQIDLRNFALKNASIRRVKHLLGGGMEVAEVSGVNITIDQLKNGESGKVTSAASFKMTRPTNDVLEARSQGTIEFTLGADLMPTTLKASAEQEILRAEGSLVELAGLRSQLAGEITPTEIKEFTQRFLRGEQVLGEVKVTGPLDLSKKEGRIKLEVTSIDRQVLNLIGAPLGIDFGATTLNSTVEVGLLQGGSVITAKTLVNVGKFSVTQEGQTTPALDLQVAWDVTVDTAKESAQLQTFTLDGTQNQQPLLRGRLSKPMMLAWGEKAGATGDSAFELAVTGFDFSAWKAFMGDAVSAGVLSLKLNLVSGRGGKDLKLGVTGQVAGLTAQFGEEPLTQGALQLALNGSVNDFSEVTLSDYRLDLTQQGQPALTVAGSAGYDGAAFRLQTQVEAVMARLMGSGPSTPLAVGVNLEGTFADQVLDLRQLRVTLTPTQLAPKNELTMAGRVDLATAGTTKGQLKVTSDTLDLTQLYDAFAGGGTSAAAPAPTPTTPAPGGEVEPEPVILPLQITAEAALGQVFLHEMKLENCQVTVKADGGKVSIDPCRMGLNGAPVNATVNLDLGVRGYTYALSLLMDRVPMEPIANTFSPDTRGQYQGFILADAKIQGAGVTGASLQRNLTGQAGFSFTNANLQLIGPKTRRLVVPIATLLRVNAITESPVNWLMTRMELGGGKVDLKRFAVQSEAFEATTQGVIALAEVLTNSVLELPVGFALRRSLAEKAKLVPADASPDAKYVVLPQFVTVKGTVGVPETHLDKLALGGLLLQSGVGIAEKLGVKLDPKAGNLLQGVGNLLTGQQPAGGTNEATTNAPPKLNPLDLFRRK